MCQKYSFVPDPFGVHYKIIQAVPENSFVLDAGCASGYIAKALQLKNCIVDGIEINREDALQAKRFCNRLITGNIEDNGIVKQIGNKKYDVIILADILEHLVFPEAVLDKMRERLKPEGIIILTIPNIAFVTNRIYHLLGNFDYTQTGIMDKTHLRFFTKKTLYQLINDSGLHVEKIEYAGNFTQLPLYMQTLYPLFKGIIWWRRVEQKFTNMWPEGLAIQFFVICK